VSDAKEDANGKSLLGTVDHLGNKLISALPAPFIMLCVINLIFVLGLLWFMDQREKQRERLFAPYLAACEKQVPIDALTQLLEHIKGLRPHNNE